MSRIRSLNISRNYRQKKDRRLEKEEIVEKRMELVRIKGVFGSTEVKGEVSKRKRLNQRI